MRVLNDSRPTVGADALSAPPLLVTPAAAAGMVGEAQLQPAAGAAGSDAGFDADMVIILAALLCVLVCALGLNSLIHYCLVLDFGRTALTVAPPAPAAATATAAGGPTTGTGLKKRELRRIPVVVYEAKPGASATDCASCLGEFYDGERVRVLPRCHHGFHACSASISGWPRTRLARRAGTRS
ncbi:unnamed protein product [Miscanthus lutarioriparius]|uniref:Uncharacterized protein n=2 Tax=Miscanthus lutarioriparius TaxID=422564 RepID=A0A811RF07_9POAL|nr:unnamed protein product [Miscanthus lutarioriparius]